ncbi:dihydroneopterin aldolase [uncultured Sunxiuqinia sp.]|uniref:dihydroneopterin aldolase n=1 Tax=uncultured Sunxiuqinia sp. TaxID=1573825 RepID=UPI0030D8EF50|tara:strand:- start:84 stop:434 length:351 start_codon:yes stop_codon:yes gene_type:complete
MGQIDLEGLEFFAYHGHYPIEKEVGNRFILNVSIQTNCDAAGKSDRLQDALDYQKVYSLIKQEMAIPSDLLEHVATRILDKLHAELPAIDKAWVKISKMNPPMGGQIEKVSVTLSR